MHFCCRGKKYTPIFETWVHTLFFSFRLSLEPRIKHINSDSVIKNVSTLQKAINRMTDDAIFLIASAVLIYSISYFFIFVNRNLMKMITLDYTTALMSLIPPIMFLAAVFIFYRIK